MSGLLRRRLPAGHWQEAQVTTSSWIAVGVTGSRPPTLASKHGSATVGVFEKDYIGAGGTGRNTTVLRANYKMPESV